MRNEDILPLVRMTTDVLHILCVSLQLPQCWSPELRSWDGGGVGVVGKDWEAQKTEWDVSLSRSPVWVAGLSLPKPLRNDVYAQVPVIGPWRLHLGVICVSVKGLDVMEVTRPRMTDLGCSHQERTDRGSWDGDISFCHSHEMCLSRWLWKVFRYWTACSFVRPFLSYITKSPSSSSLPCPLLRILIIVYFYWL